MSRVSMFSAPFLLGFDAYEERIDRLSRAADGYPPYNIERTVESDGSESFLISIAVAGFAQAELEITQEDNQLLVRGRPQERLEHAGPGVGIQVGRAAVARLAEPPDIHRHVAQRVLVQDGSDSSRATCARVGNASTDNAASSRCVIHDRNGRLAYVPSHAVPARIAVPHPERRDLHRRDACDGKHSRADGGSG